MFTTINRIFLLLLLIVFNFLPSFIWAKSTTRLSLNSQLQVSIFLSEFDKLQQLNYKISLQRVMSIYNVHALSIAIIEHGKLAKLYHFRHDLPKQYRLDQNTVFRVASISKWVTSLLTLKLVDHHKLDFDKNVNNYLQSWKLPLNYFTRIKYPTIRNILDMTSAINYVHFNGYLKNQPWPTLLDVLNGKYPARNTPITVIAHIPGTFFKYSTGGYAVLEQAITDQLHLSYNEVAETYLFKPLKISDVYYSHSPRDGNYAPSYTPENHLVKGGYSAFIVLSGEGLWAAPNGIATLLINFMKSFNHQNGFFTQELAKEALSYYPNTPFGLGPKLNGHGQGLYFYKYGNNVNCASIVLGFPYQQDGVIIMTDSGQGIFLIQALLKKLAENYRWPSSLNHVSVY